MLLDLLRLPEFAAGLNIDLNILFSRWLWLWLATGLDFFQFLLLALGFATGLSLGLAVEIKVRTYCHQKENNKFDPWNFGAFFISRENFIIIVIIVGRLVIFTTTATENAATTVRCGWRKWILNPCQTPPWCEHAPRPVAALTLPSLQMAPSLFDMCMIDRSKI